MTGLLGQLVLPAQSRRLRYLQDLLEGDPVAWIILIGVIVVMCLFAGGGWLYRHLTREREDDRPRKRRMDPDERDRRRYLD